MDMFAAFIDALMAFFALVIFLTIGGLALTILVTMYFYKRLGK